MLTPKEQEWKEKWQKRIDWIVAILSVLTGLIGALTGYVALTR